MATHINKPDHNIHTPHPNGVYFISWIKNDFFQGCRATTITAHYVIDHKTMEHGSGIEITYPHYLCQPNFQIEEFVYLDFKYMVQDTAPGSYGRSFVFTHARYYLKSVDLFSKAKAAERHSQKQSKIIERSSQIEKFNNRYSKRGNTPTQPSTSITKSRNIIRKEYSLTNNQPDDSDNSLFEDVIDWDFIEFLDMRILVRNPFGGRGLSVKLETSKADYGRIKPHFKLNCPSLVGIFDEERTLRRIHNIEIINDFIETLETSEQLKIKKVKPKNSQDKLKKCRAVAITEIPNIIGKRPSQYLEYLCKKHLSEEKVYYCRELLQATVGKNGIEKAFIFLIGKKKGRCALVFENILESRSSVIFIVEEDHYKEAVKVINSFFASKEENKREAIQQRRLKFNRPVLMYTRVIHNNFNQWKWDIDAIEKIL